MKGSIDGWVDGWMDGYVDGWMGRSINGWMDMSIDGYRMDGWTTGTIRWMDDRGD